MRIGPRNKGRIKELDDFPEDITYYERNMIGKKQSVLLPLAALIALFAVGGRPANAQDEPNSVLTFYVQRAAATFTSRDPFIAGVKFSLRATTYYKDLSRGGKTTLTDSSIIDYYYSFGALDSTSVIAAPRRKHPPLNIAIPNVFSTAYTFSFFPNDTGGADLPIGFDTSDTPDTLPTGIVVIDRNRYFLKWLYLFFPNDVGYKRYSQSFRFTELEGFVFADSIWEVRAEAGIFSSKNFRIEIGIDSLRIYR